MMICKYILSWRYINIFYYNDFIIVTRKYVLFMMLCKYYGTDAPTLHQAGLPVYTSAANGSPPICANCGSLPTFARSICFTLHNLYLRCVTSDKVLRVLLRTTFFALHCITLFISVLYILFWYYVNLFQFSAM